MKRLDIDVVPALVLEGRQITGVGEEAAGAGGEVPNLGVTLDNARGQLTELFADPPLRATATLTEDGTTLFIGRVQQVTLSAVITVSLEA